MRTQTSASRWAMNFLIVGLLISSSGCGQESDKQPDSVGTRDSLPTETISLYEVPIRDVAELAGMSTVVVTATLKGVREAYFTYEEPKDDDPDAGRIEYDGYVFEPIEWVKGEEADGDLVVARESMSLESDGTPIARLIPNGYPIDSHDVGRSYLLFLGPAYGGTVGDILVPTSAHFGIVEILPDGTIVLTDPKNSLDPLYEVRNETIDRIVARISG